MFKIKEMYYDYLEMVVKPEKEFYEKHLVGAVLINAAPITAILCLPAMIIKLISFNRNVK